MYLSQSYSFFSNIVELRQAQRKLLQMEEEEEAV